MKNILLSLVLALIFAGQSTSQTITVHVSGTVTRDSTGLPVPDHQVIIEADSNSYGYTFYATRRTSANGVWDCTIHNVPATGAAVVFIVSTKDCDSSVLIKSFVGTTTADTVNFVICNGNSSSCEANFHAVPDVVHFGLVEFYDISTPVGGIVSWEWGFGDPASGTANVSNLQNPYHFYSGPGTYEVCLHIATANGCTSYKCGEVVVEQQVGCEASYHYYTDSTNTLHLHFYDTSNPADTIISRYWTFGDGGTSNTYDPWHVYASPGIYNVCLTIVTSDSCTSTKCDEIHVATDSNNCEGWITYSATFLTVQFEGHTHSPYPTSYTWQMGDPSATTLTGQAVSFTYPAAGEYTVTLVTLDSTGCEFSATKTITIHATCDLYGYVHAGDLPVDHGIVELYKADGGALTLVEVKEFGDSTGLYWFGGVAQGHYYVLASLLESSVNYGMYVPTYYQSAVNWAEANMIELGAPENPYSIAMVHVLGCGAGPGTISGVISQNTKMNSGGSPAADVEVLLQNSSGNPLSFTVTDQQGQFEFTNIAYGTYSIYPEVTGKTTIPSVVTLDAAHQTISTSFTIQGNNIAGIGDKTSAGVSAVSQVFPNPASDKAQLTISTMRETEITVSMYFITGERASEFSYTLEHGVSQVAIPIKDLAPGLYYLSLKDNQGNTVIRKLVIRR